MVSFCHWSIWPCVKTFVENGGEITCNNIGTQTGDYLADVCFLLFWIDAILYPEGLEQLSTF